MATITTEPFTGTGDADVIYPNGGVDTVQAGGGDDEIILTVPLDFGSRLDGGSGFDTLVLRPQPGVPYYNGGTITQYNAYFPTAIVSLEAVRFESAAGDFLALVVIESQRAAAGLTTLVGGAGRDVLYDVVFTPGTYTMPELSFQSWNSNIGDANFDFVTLLASSSGNYILNAREGLPTIQGLRGNSGDDILNGSSGSDALDGRAGVNQLYGNGGDDILLAQNLVPYGGVATTLTFAGSIFNGGGGEDVLVIGGRVDFQGMLAEIENIRFEPAVAPPAPGFDGLDPAHLILSAANVLTLSGNARISGSGTLEINLGAITTFDASAYQMDAGDTISIVINGSSSDDTIVGTTASDTLSGGGGGDSLEGGDGNDSLDGGSEFDSAHFTFQAGPGALALVSDADGLSILRDGERVAGISVNGTTVRVQGVNSGAHLGGDDLTSVEQLNFSIAESPSQLRINVVDASAATGFLAGSGDADIIIAGAGNDSIDGGGSADFIIGGAGTDILAGGGGDDRLEGGEGGDGLFGDSYPDNSDPAGNDILIGGGGDDTLYGGGGVDHFDGGSGFDRVFFNFRAATQGVWASLATGQVLNDGFGNAETMISIEGLGPGTAFADTFIGSDQFDFFEGSFGDTLIGGGGNDHFEIAGAPATIDGDVGVDMLSFSSMQFGALVPDSNQDGLAERVFAAHGVNVDLGINRIIDDGFGRSGEVYNVESLVGSSFADRLVGSAGNNYMQGLGGHDLMSGGAGSDSLEGGDGNDSLDGGADFDSAHFTFQAAPGALSLVADGLGLVVQRGGENMARISATATGVIVQGLNPASHLGTDTLAAIESLNFSVAGSLATLNVRVTTGTASGNFLDGTPGHDVFLGLGGNDTISGNSGNDLLDGGDGNDVLRGDAGSTFAGPGGDDILLGGGGDDLLSGGAGVDRFDGGPGMDRIAFNFRTATEAVRADLFHQMIWSDGFGNTEQMNSIEGLGGGTAFADTFVGDDNANILIGDVGDVILANGGNDVIELGGAPAEIDGGSGIDTITGFTGHFGILVPDGPDEDSLADVVFATMGVDVDLGAQRINEDGFGNSGILRNVENIGGGRFADRLIGDANANVLNGFLGADTLVGGADNDTLDGGDDSDTASYASAGGSVTVNLGTGVASGADGNDTLVAIENVTGSAFNDTLTGDGNGNLLDGLGGNDNISGGAGDDIVFGGDGDDFLNGDLSETSISVTGNDLLNGGNGNDNLRGGLGNDTLIGGANNDLFRGNGGVDYFDGGSDDGEGFNGIGDRVSFFERRATQGAIADLRTGVISNDGFGNVETMVGIESLGGDTAYVDTFYGNDARNLLGGGLGDYLYGFGGDDGFQMSAAAAVIDGGLGTDLLALNSTGAWLMPDTNADGLAEIAAAATSGWMVHLTAGTIGDGYGNSGSITGIENVDGGHLGDTITGNADANVLNGFDGDDTLEGRAGDDTLDGGAGIDTASYADAAGGVTVNLGTGVASGADGNDTLLGIENVIGSAFNDTIAGNGGANSLFGGSGNDIVNGDGDDDRLVGGAGFDTLGGGAGIDTIDYSTSPSGVSVNLTSGKGKDGDADGDTISNVENIIGSLSADKLTGDSLSNVLNGGGGNDIIAGAGGADTLFGGGGMDTFLFNSLADLGAAGNVDQIMDFDAGGSTAASRVDLINLGALDANSRTANKDDPFTFIGAAAFSNKAGELRFDAATGTLSGDVNGDGIADLSLNIVVLGTLDSSDFVL